MKKGINPKKNKKLLLNLLLMNGIKPILKVRSSARTVAQRDVQMASLKKHFVNKPIIKITHLDYQNLLNDLDDKKFAYNTISGIQNVANMIFKYAIKTSTELTTQPLMQLF